MTMSLIDYWGKHEGETIIVCGLGASLASGPLSEDVIAAINENVTIGVNDIVRLFSPTYLLVLDQWKTFDQGRQAYIQMGAQFAVAAFTPHGDIPGEHTTVVEFPAVMKQPYIALKPNMRDDARLFVAMTTPYTAVNLACFMGAKKVGLIGVDFTHHEAEDFMEEVNLDYLGLHYACDDAGVILRNLSDQSLLETVEKCSYEELKAL